jgi:hypothetical protein
LYPAVLAYFYGIQLKDFELIRQIRITFEGERLEFRNLIN